MLTLNCNGDDPKAPAFGGWYNKADDYREDNRGDE
jgi:hypothetical protein